MLNLKLTSCDVREFLARAYFGITQSVDSVISNFLFYFFFDILCRGGSHIWKPKVTDDFSTPGGGVNVSLAADKQVRIVM